jgi:hypothetical protein
MAKTIDEELMRKKVEKEKNAEFNQQGNIQLHFESKVIIEKSILVNRDNQILLNKLVEISHGKWVIIHIII